MPAETVWTLAAFFLTVLVLSYILGDNPLFRIATYLLVGVSAGYVTVLIIYQVLITRLFNPFLSGNLQQKLLLLIPIALGFLLLFKLFPKLSSIGNVSMGFLVGVGVAIAIGGAITGTLFGQIQGAISGFDLSAAQGNAIGQLAGGIFLLGGTITSLAYFHFGARSRTEPTPARPPVVEILAKIGQIFIAVTFGSLFAGVLAAAVTALIERLDFIIGFFQSLFT
jgi:hypothetical protein